MGIKIDKITVRNLGPIQAFSEDLGPFNIIFSRNECGKTFLTEFIIRSLFRNIKRWQFRENGSGKVTVSGLDSTGPVDFSPGTVKKLEDFWQQDQSGLPLSMVKLLVSKGGESSIEDSDEGIGKSLIKEIFSGISLLDRIDADVNISRTVKDAQLEGSSINIGNTGKGKTYRQLKTEVDRIDSLFSEIESKYTKGVLEAYKTEERLLKDRMERLNRAKRHEAFEVSEKIKGLNKKLAANDEEMLLKLASDIGFYEEKKAEYSRSVGQLEEFKRKCAHYEWLQKALPVYEKFSAVAAKKPSIIIAVASAILAAAAVIFSIFNISIGTIISLVACFGLITFYIIRLTVSFRKAASSEELSRLKKEFKSRTGSDLTDIVALQLEIDRQKESYDNSKLLARQLEDLKIKIQVAESAIQQKFCSMTGSRITEDEWQAALGAKREENRDLKSDIETLREKQTDLAVREVEYLPENPGVEFSYGESEKVSKSLEDIRSKIDDIERNIESLKYGVCNETNDDQSIDWEHLMENLGTKRLEKLKEYDICQAQIIAGILVHSEIETLRQEEDIKISEGLRSDIVTRPLMEVTKNYKRLFLDGESLMVSDDFKDYCIRDLSTGAREQIMLALRIGFASKILKQDSLFLILDDAFQHSDWERRKILVNKLADIAQNGWQVIYLSMDNHIRELFDKAGERFKKGQYRRIEIAP